MTTSITEIANKILAGELTADEAVKEYTAAISDEMAKCQEAKRKEEEEKARIAEQKAFEDTRRVELSEIIDRTLDFIQHYFPDFVPPTFKLTREEAAEMADDIIAEIEHETARMKPYMQFLDLFGKDTTTTNEEEPKPVKTTMGDIPVGKKEHTAFTSSAEEDLFNDLMTKLFGACAN